MNMQMKIDADSPVIAELKLLNTVVVFETLVCEMPAPVEAALVAHKFITLVIKLVSAICFL